jgi:signal transduction histidine kinase
VTAGRQRPRRLVRNPAHGPLRPPEPHAPARAPWPLRRVFAVGSTVAAVLVLAAVVLGAVALERLGDARGVLLDGVAPALAAGQELSVALLNQETGVRGYDLSGRDEFLEPYRDGLLAEQAAVSTLRAVADTAGLEELPADLDAVERAVRAWRAGFADPVIAQGGLDTGVASVDPVPGQALFDDVRAGVDRLVTRLTGEQAAARARVEDAVAFLVAVGITIAAALVLSLLAASVGLRRGVLEPVSHLAAQTRDVVSGDMVTRVHGTGPRELVELGEDVEAMRAHILAELGLLQEVNRRLDEQTRDLERSNRDLEQFAYVASHDLQEPLRKVSSFCQLLQRRYGGQLDERADQYIGFAIDGAQRMQRLINDLLAFSRVGRTTEAFEPVALDDVAAATAAQLEAVREELGGEITVGELPEVTGDRTLLTQLLVNLVGNGLKFHREDVAPVVAVTAAPGLDGTWEIAVTDNGIGIEPEYADKVFVIFQRLHARDVYAGTGIGLALAKKIVEFHGGRIWLADPPPGGGTAIRFTLPARPAEPDEPGPAPEETR